MENIIRINPEYQGEPGKKRGPGVKTDAIPEKEEKKPKPDRPKIWNREYHFELSEAEAKDLYKKSFSLLSEKNFIKLYVLKHKIDPVIRRSYGYSEKTENDYFNELKNKTVSELESILEEKDYTELFSRPSYALALIEAIETKSGNAE